jgi:predicted PhzF superfamily epimerase YddE/YHI9
VTGSIHAGLAPYWAQRLNKTRLSALQASQRGGVLDCRVADGRVFVAGGCRAVFGRDYQPLTQPRGLRLNSLPQM